MNDLIRPVEPQDLPQLVSLCRMHAQYEGAAYDDKGKEERLRSALFAVNPPVFCFVASKGETLTGYVAMTIDYSTWDADYFLHMDCLYICEDSRGSGLGKAFINLIKEFAKERACTHIQWQTPVDNDKAIDFYKKQGATSKNKLRFFLSL